MALNSSWFPDEDSQTLFAERCWLQGVIIGAIAYGITVSLYFLSFYLLVHGNNRIEFKKRLPLLIYISISFILGTLFMITVSAFTQMSFIDDRNYPGGPNAFETDMFSIPMDYLGSVAFVLSNWLSDALVVWRVKVIYQMCGLPTWVVMFFPCLLFAGSVALGIIFLVQVATTNPYVTTGVNVTLPYLSLSLALNIILTIAIVLRLLRVRYYIVNALGPKHGSRYTSLAAMIIESAALYSAMSLTFLILFGIGDTLSKVFLQSLNQFQPILTGTHQTIAMLLIIFRVAQGKGWTEDTATRVMSVRALGPLELTKIQFASAETSGMLTSSADPIHTTSREFQGIPRSSDNCSTLKDMV